MTETGMRTADLRQMLRERRRDVCDEVQSRMRDGRTDRPNEVRDRVEVSDADIQGDLGLALLQMRADTVTRIDEALGRLDGGKYGTCFTCSREIPERRLRALPFAVRCQACEERHETKQGDARQRALRRVGSPPFQDVSSS